jgi:hypothetical protein
MKMKIMTTITATTTSGSLYTNSAANPLGGMESEIRALYRVIYSQYRVEISPPTGDELEREILTNFLEPIGEVGIMVVDLGSKTGWLNRHARYSSRPRRSHADRGASLCFEGEVDGTDAYTVAFDNDHLGMNRYVNMPRILEHHQDLLDDEPTKAMVRPFKADEANVHTIRIRGGMFIPYELVEFLLGKDLSAREAYLVMYPLLEKRSLLEVWYPLVEFLQLASTQPTA